MPHRNIIRHFEANMSYHCYNRGVEKRQVFVDQQDYGVFLARLKMMLADPGELREEYTNRERIRSFYGRIELRAYCLMPNHFHLLLHQYDAAALADFMRTLSTSYTMYFNNRHQRVGPLFQGRYKASEITSDAYDMHISRYIHLNPYELTSDYEEYAYSSMQFVLHPERTPAWVSIENVLQSHGSRETYRKFVKEYAAEDLIEQLDDVYTLD